MSVELATGYVSVVPSARGMQGNLTRQMGGPAAAAGAASGRTMGGTMAGGVLGAARRMAPAAGAILGGVGLVRFGREVAGVSGQAQRTEASLSALYDAAGHGADEATRATSLLWDEFGRSSLGMEPFQKGAESLAYLGLNAGESVGVMSFLEDAILATGGGAEQMTRVTEALTSAQNRGKATMMELNRISAAGVPILDMLSSEMGITTGEVMEMASAGEISIDDLTRVLQDVPGQWGPALQAGADEVRKTLPVAWSSATSTITNSIAKNIMPMVDRLAPHVVRAGDAIAAGMAMVPVAFDAVSTAVGTATTAMSNVAGFVSDNSTAFTALAAVAGTVMLPTLVSMATAWAAKGLAAVVSGAQTVAVWTMLQASAIRGAATFLAQQVRIVAGWVLMGTQSLIQGARMAAAWVIAMGPVGWVIAAVVGLVALIIANWDTVVEWTRKAWEWVSGAVSSAWEWVTSTTSSAVSSVSDFVSGMRDRVVSAVTNLRDRVVSFFGNLRDRVTSTTSNLRDQVVNFVTAMRDRVVSAVTNLRDRVANFINSMRDQAVSTVTNLRNQAVSTVTNLRDTAVNLVTNLRDQFLNRVTNLRNQAVSTVTNLRDQVVSFITGMRDTVVSVVTGMRDSVAGFFGGMRDSVVSVATNVRDNVTSRFSSMRDGVTTAASNVRSSVSASFSGMRDNLVTTASNARSSVVSTFSGMRDSVSSTISSLMDRVRGIRSDVTGFFSGAGTWLRQAGRNIIRGLISGIGDMIGAVGNQVDRVVSSVTDRLPWSPAKTGPLSTHPPEKGGANIVSMLADGMGSQIGGLSRMADAAAAAALPDLGEVRIPRGPDAARAHRAYAPDAAGGTHRHYHIDAPGTYGEPITEEGLLRRMRRAERMVG